MRRIIIGALVCMFLVAAAAAVAHTPLHGSTKLTLVRQSGGT